MLKFAVLTLQISDEGNISWKVPCFSQTPFQKLPVIESGMNFSSHSAIL